MDNLKTIIEARLAKLEDQLDLWNAKVRELAAKANTATQQAKIDSRKEVEELRAKLDTARAKLDEAKAVGVEKWGIVKQGVERVWEDLEGTFKRLVG
jgi:uncharacterized coiled-coil DUF342 family protein